LDAGGASIWLLAGPAFLVTPTTLPGGTKEQLQELLSPVITKLDQSNITYGALVVLFLCYPIPDRSKLNILDTYLTLTDLLLAAYFIDEFPTFYDSYQAMNPPANIVEFQLGGRLIPRSVVESNTPGLMAALRTIAEHGAVISGVSVNATRKSHYPSNSVNPAWRDAVISVVLGT